MGVGSAGLSLTVGYQDALDKTVSQDCTKYSQHIINKSLTHWRPQPGCTDIILKGKVLHFYSVCNLSSSLTASISLGDSPRQRKGTEGLYGP